MPFNGKREEQDPEDWLEYFERYCNYKNLSENQRGELFVMMMRGGASDWLHAFAAQSDGSSGNWKKLKEAFQENYFRSPELRWKDAGAMWQEAQKPNERVEDYVARMRKIASRLQFDEPVLHMAIINGLKPAVRMHVAQQGLRDLEQTIRAAKIAEAAGTTASDSISVALMEMMKASMKASEKQASQMQQLADTVASLNKRDSPAVQSDPPRNSWKQQTIQLGNRQVKPSPQNIQRANYVRQTANRQPQGQRDVQTDRSACGNCGLQHRQGNCSARGVPCRHCNKIGHFARVCRSANATRN